RYVRQTATVCFSSSMGYYLYYGYRFFTRGRIYLISIRRQRTTPNRTAECCEIKNVLLWGALVLSFSRHINDPRLGVGVDKAGRFSIAENYIKKKPFFFLKKGFLRIGKTEYDYWPMTIFTLSAASCKVITE
ncbi:MAG: hypothetical protein RLZZ77_204, partial [Bacteroidota bacterium]